MFSNFIKELTTHTHLTTTTHNPNLTPLEIKNYYEIKQNTQLIIKPADKNIGLTLMSKDTYLNMANKDHLNDTTTYKQLNTNPLQTTINVITSMINNELKHKRISKTTASKMYPPKNSKLGTFYILPKLHKTKLQSRPIIASINHPTSRISKYIDTILRPIVVKTPTYIKNSLDIIQHLKGIKTKETHVLITADISSLYTNIEQEFGATTVTNYIYKNYRNEIKINKTSFKTILRHVLINNIFEFDKKYFLQKVGTAMVTIMAPNYANIYLSSFENKLIQHPQFKTTTKLFKRFIDDLFIIYDNKNNDINEFLSTLKQIYGNLKLEINSDNEEINFLDIKIIKNKINNKYETQLYTKPIGAPKLLHAKSNHPSHIITNISKGQLIRINNLTSDYNKKRLESNRLLKRMMEQQHDPKIIIKNIKTIIKTNNQHSILKNINDTKPKIIKYTFNQDNHQLAKFIKQSWKNENITNKLKPQLRIINKTNPSFKKLLIKSKTPSDTTATPIQQIQKIQNNQKTENCEKKKCLTCQYKDLSLNTKHTKNNFKPTSCYSNSIIYLIKCKKCQKEYIGESRSNAYQRIRTHISDIKRNKNTSIAHHFNKHDHSYINDFKFNIVLNGPMTTTTRRHFESTLIRQNKTHHPYGLNRKY
jgi:hypothetical protein